LYVCPLAFLEGLRLFKEFVRTLERETAGPSYDDMIEALNGARALYPRYRRAVLKIDRGLWPENPPPRLLATLAILPLTKAERWFIWDPITALICPAEPPEQLSAPTQRNLDAIRRTIQRELPMSTDWVSIALLDVTLNPRPNARWQPAGSVLANPPFLDWKTGPSPLSPVELEVDEEGNLRRRPPSKK
jgi:hypothetical protein